jgi:hypothetical protein
MEGTLAPHLHPWRGSHLRRCQLYQCEHRCHWYALRCDVNSCSSHARRDEPQIIQGSCRGMHLQGCTSISSHTKVSVEARPTFPVSAWVTPNFSVDVASAPRYDASTHEGGVFLNTREEKADELTAILGASRELTPETDRYLAEQFIDRLENRTRRTDSRRRFTARKTGNRRSAFTTLCVAALALAIGTPLSFRASQNYAPQSIALNSVMCAWPTQTLHFASPRVAYRWESSPHPGFRILGQSPEASDSATVSVAHWVCWHR